MIPAQCDYHRAGSVDEALELLGTHADRDPTLLAGGHGLVPDMKVGRASPNVLVDIRGIDGLSSIDVDGNTVTVGALTTHATLADANALVNHVPVLADAASEVADRQIRNRGTIGGNLAEADPAADLPPAVLAADGTIEVQGRDGTRSIDAADFFEGSGETALGPDEVLTTVHLPADDGSAYVRKTHPASGYAMLSVAVRAAVVDGAIPSARVAVGGLTSRPVRLDAVETALEDASADAPPIERAANRAKDGLDGVELRGDHVASADYRRGVLPEYVERTLRESVARAGDEDRD